VQQAEVYVSLTGAEKKAHAYDFVLEALDELESEEGTGLIFSIIPMAIKPTVLM